MGRPLSRPSMRASSSARSALLPRTRMRALSHRSCRSESLPSFLRRAASARVRAVRLTGKTLIPGILEAPPILGAAVETRTGADGSFHFPSLAPGGYKLWVQPQGDDQGWIRRLKMEPDVRIPPGEVVVMKPFRIKVLLDG